MSPENAGAPRSHATWGAKPALWLVLALVVLLGLMLTPVRHARAATTYTVTSTADDTDDNIGNGVCHTAAGACTLRAAIQEANLSAGVDTIGFNIAGCVGGVCIINLASDLPAVSDAAIINGYSQTGSSVNTTVSGGLNSVILIELRPDPMGSTATIGLNLTSTSASTVEGLIIVGFQDHTTFSGSGILAAGGGSHLIQGNYIGTDGASPLYNDIGVQTTSAGNTIGGTLPAARNLISGNFFAGLDLASTGNAVKGNLIGPDPSGLLQGDGNAFTGVYITGNGNTVGGTTVAERNVISGNAQISPLTGYAGVVIDLGAGSNIIEGNYIGSDVTGLTWLPNGVGIDIPDGSGNTIGGTTAGAGNLISGNLFDGIELASCGCGPVNANTVQGNFIGTDATGTQAINVNGLGPQQDHGVYIQGFGPGAEAKNNLIGGSVAGARNVLSGNNANGVFIAGSIGSIDGSETSMNQVQGNYIGTNAAGTGGVPNNGDGIFISAAASNTIGGGVGAGNLISGNNSDGVDINNAFGSNVVQGNLIGTNISGTGDLGNLSDGVDVEGTPNTLVGGSTTGQGNLISGNQGDGMQIGQSSTGTQVQGNLIGTNAAGSAALSNLTYGVSIQGVNAQHNAVGGTAAGQGNVIAFNGGAVYDGVNVDTGTFNPVRGNTIFSNGHLPIALINGGNASLPPPAISTVTAVSASGTTAPVCGSCLIDIYSGDSALNARKFEGTATTNGAGIWTFTSGTVFANAVITATTTDGSNNTSQLSAGSTIAAPLFTSANNTTFNLNVNNTFNVTTNYAGTAAASGVTIAMTGTPPPGVSFTDNHNGTGVLGGTPTALGSTPYSLTFTATYATLSTPQSFTLSLVNTSATLAVSKTYSDGHTTPVSVAMSCTSGATVALTPQNVTPGTPTIFTINGIGVGGTQCTATETVPGGYTADQSQCNNVSLAVNDARSCTIANTLVPTAGSFTVHVHFSDGNSANVTLHASCDNGAVASPASLTAHDSPDTPATFSVTGIPVAGTHCTATQTTVSAGYSADASACASVAVAQGGSGSCIITDTLVPTSASLTVHKQFTDANTASVTIHVTCSNGAVPTANNLAAKGNPDVPAVFTIGGIGAGGTLCTATETGGPAGYIASQAACANIALNVSDTKSCIIVNSLAPVLSIVKSHSGDFLMGQVGAQYKIVVSDAATAGPTTGSEVDVTDLLATAPGLTITAMSGTGWSCVLATLTCSRSDVLLPGAAYPAITVTANVSATAGALQTNQAGVAGGGTAAPVMTADATKINPPGNQLPNPPGNQLPGVPPGNKLP